MTKLNKENLRLCDTFRDKLKGGKEDKEPIVEDRIKDLSDIIDARFDHTVAKLRALQDEIKKRYRDVINSNLD